MAKIQRVKISTDEKMSMLRGQPGHMAPAGLPSAEPSEAQKAAESDATTTPEVQPTPVAEVAVEALKMPPVATKRGRGRPPKVATVAPAPKQLPPSLIRLEGATQLAVLAYLREELLRGRRVYLKEFVDEAVNFYLQHGPPAGK